MKEKKTLIEIQKDKIISLAKEYVENVKCSCYSCGPKCCWKCLFEHNFNVLEYEQAKCICTPNGVQIKCPVHGFTGGFVSPPVG